jgi:hypothetical protein
MMILRVVSVSIERKSFTTHPAVLGRSVPRRLLSSPRRGSREFAFRNNSDNFRVVLLQSFIRATDRQIHTLASQQSERINAARKAAGITRDVPWLPPQQCAMIRRKAA